VLCVFSRKATYLIEKVHFLSFMFHQVVQKHYLGVVGNKLAFDCPITIFCSGTAVDYFNKLQLYTYLLYFLFDYYQNTCHFNKITDQVEFKYRK